MQKIFYLLGQLDDGDIEWIAANSSQQVFAAAEAIIEINEYPKQIYIILNGEAGVWLKDKKIADIGVGEVIGEISLVDSRPATATVKASTELICLAISREILLPKLEANPEFSSRFYKGIAMFLSDRMRESMLMLEFSDINNLTPIKQGIELSDELLDTAHLAGARFERIMQILSAVK